jgi:glycosyltransferase involved in cell wall biosynthesis
MRIAQVATLHESVPPNGYGGVERVVHYLTEELVQRGHDVTLFASGDSRTSGTLEAVVAQALRNNPDVADPFVHQTLLLERVQRRAADFDILHFHLDYLHFPLMRISRHSHVTTQHNRMDLRDLPPLFREFRDLPQISISRHQRSLVPQANWIGTVHNALPEDLLAFDPRGGDDLVFIGRICPEKRPDRAIRIASATGRPLKIAAKIDDRFRDYFDAVVKPLMARAPDVQFLGEVDEKGKQQLLCSAYALVFPIDWPEPFGMVMIEALACGTPVIAWRQGAVPEVIEDGRSGYVVETLEAATEAVQRLESLSRAECRKAFEERFTAARMADDYLAIYRKTLAAQERPCMT